MHKSVKERVTMILKHRVGYITHATDRAIGLLPDASQSHDDCPVLHRYVVMPSGDRHSSAAF